MKKIMVMMNDPQGLPRAWAVAETREQALEEANRQLEIYRAKKRESGDELADAVFTPSFKEIESSDCPRCGQPVTSTASPGGALREHTHKCPHGQACGATLQPCERCGKRSIKDADIVKEV